MKKKTYFYADEMVDEKTGRKSLVFYGQNKMRGHRAGWGPDNVNFVLEKLAQKRGMSKWIRIYKAFNDALLEVSKEKKEHWKFPKGVLVMFENERDDNRVFNGESDNEVANKDLHKGESRLQEAWKS